MGLLDSSLVNSTNATSLASVTAAQKQAATVAAGSTVKSGTTATATNPLTAIVKSAQKMVTDVVSNVSGVLGSATGGGVAKSVATSADTSALFKNTNTTTASAVKTTTNDPVATSFTGKTPKSTLFTTNATSSQAQPVKLTGAQSTVTSGISGISSAISTIASRVGYTVKGAEGDVVSGLNSAVGSTMQGAFTAGLYTNLKGVVGSAVGAYGAAVSATSTITSTITDFRKLASGISRELTGSIEGLDAYFDQNLAAITDSTGALSSGEAGYVPFATASSIANAASNLLGCPVTTGSATASGATQSLYGAMINITSQLSATSLLSQLLGCSSYTSYAQQTTAALIPTVAGTNATVAQTLSTNTNAAQISTASLASVIVTNKNATASDVGTIQSLLANLGMTNSEGYTIADTQIGSSPVYNSTVVAASNSELTSALVGTAVAQTSNGVAIA